jgi:predicted dehydrogenase
MSKIKVGLIGAGQIAYSHCREINAHPEAAVTAVADPSIERGRALAAKFGIGGVFSSAEELFRRSAVDAVSIAVPNRLHAPLALAALKARKHVMLDKPFALNAREAEAVVAAAEEAGRVFMLGMNQRFSEEAQTVKALVERGELGKIYHAKAYWMRRSGIPKLGTWFGDKKMAGGGCMLDIGVHVLDLCLYLMNNFEPVSVFATTKTVFGNRGLGEGGWGMSDRAQGKLVFTVEDFAAALIRMKNGATVQLEVSWAQHQDNGDRHNVELFGTEAGVTTFPAQLCKFGKNPGEYEVTRIEGVKGPYSGTNRFANWIDVMLKKAKPCATARQAVAVQKILDAIYTSARTGHDAAV